jgi:hypothetical protein
MLDQYNELLKKIADSYNRNITIIKRKPDESESEVIANNKNDLIKSENNSECLLTSKKFQ